MSFTFEIAQVVSAFLDFPDLVRCASVNKDSQDTWKPFQDAKKDAFLQQVFQVGTPFEVIPLFGTVSVASVGYDNESDTLIVSGKENLENFPMTPSIRSTLDILGWDDVQVVFRFRTDSFQSVRKQIPFFSDVR